MSHESVIASLKKLTNWNLFAIPADVHRIHIELESDRTSIILSAAMVEDFLVVELKKKMPSLNSDETDRILRFEGPLGSYSNRIRMAQALGIIDRKTARSIDIIRELRNAAAHGHVPIDFDTPEVAAAVVQLFEPKLRPEIAKWKKKRLRRLYEKYCASLIYIMGEGTVDGAEVIQRVRARKRDSRRALLEKLLAASRQMGLPTE